MDRILASKVLMGSGKFSKFPSQEQSKQNTCPSHQGDQCPPQVVLPHTHLLHKINIHQVEPLWLSASLGRLWKFSANFAYEAVYVLALRAVFEGVPSIVKAGSCQ